MATKEQLKTWIVENQDKQGKEGKDGQDFEKVKAKYISLRGEDKPTKTGDYSTGAERARTVAQGVTLGFADEIEAGARSLFSDRKYKDIRDEIRQDTKDFRTDNPGQALALEMAGGVVIPGGVLRSGAKLAGQAATKSVTKTPFWKRPPNKKAEVNIATDPVSNSANTYKKALGTNAALGATYGAGASESESVSGIAADTALGGAVGGAVGGALLGASRQLKPMVSKFGQRLAREAMERADNPNPLIAMNPGFVTKGQAEVSKFSKKTEEQLSNAFSGIREAQKGGAQGYNMQVFNDVLDTILKGRSTGNTAGNKALREKLQRELGVAQNNTEKATVVRKLISENYDNAFNNVKINTKEKAFKDELNKLLFTSKIGKTEDASEAFAKILNTTKAQLDVIVPNKSGAVAGEQINMLYSTLKNQVRTLTKAKAEGDPLATQLLKDVVKLKAIVEKQMAKGNKVAYQNLKNTDKAYGSVSGLYDAVARSKAKGFFSPVQAASTFKPKAINTNTNRANVATQSGIDGIGNRALNEANPVVGRVTGDSGTTGSLISTGSLLGLGGLIGSGAVLHPAILGMIAIAGAKAFQYSPYMLKRFNKMIANKEYRKSADLLERYAVTSGAAGVEVNQLINELRQGR